MNQLSPELDSPLNLTEDSIGVLLEQEAALSNIRG